MASNNRPNVRQISVGTLIAIVTSVAIPVLITTGAGSPTSATVGFIIAWVLAAYAGICLSILYVYGSPRPMRVGFWVFVYFFLGLAPLVQISHSRWPLVNAPSPGTIAQAAVIAVIGVVVWEVSYLVVSHRKSRTPVASISEKRWKVFVAAAVALSVVFAATIGLSPLFTSRESLDETLAATFGSVTSTGAIALVAGTVPVAIALLVVLQKRRQYPHKYAGLLVLLLATNLLVTNPISTPRFWVGSVGLAAFLAWGPGAGHPNRMRAFIVGWLAAFLIVFPLADTFRYTTGSHRAVLNGVNAQLTSGDFDAFQQMTNGVKFVKSHGFQRGEQLLGAVLVFVPRSKWPNKPHSTGEVLASSACYAYTNLSAPLWIEGYTDFGIAGVVLFLGALGMAGAALDRRFSFAVATGQASLWMVAVPLLAAYQIVLLRGPLIAMTTRLMAMALCWWFLTVRTSKAAGPD